MIQAVWSMLRSHELTQNPGGSVSESTETKCAQKELFLPRTTYWSMCCYWTYQSQDESKSSFLHSASPEKSSGTVQNQTCEKSYHSSVWSVLFVLFLTGSVSKQFRVNIAAEIRELDNLRHILLWTIKSDRRFSIPNSNASTINKSIW